MPQVAVPPPAWLAPPSARVRELMSWVGRRADSVEGRKIGRVDGILVDRQTGEPTWLLLECGVRRSTVAPLGGVVAGPGRLTLPHAHAVTDRAPAVPPDGGLSAKVEREACTAFGLPATRGAALAQWERRRTTAFAGITAEGLLVWTPEPRYEGEARRSTRGSLRPVVPGEVLPQNPRTQVVAPYASARPPHQAAPHASLPRAVELLLGGAHPVSLVARVRHPNIRVVGALADGDKVLDALRRQRPDLALLAEDLPGTDVHDIVFLARQEHLPTRIVVLGAPDAAADLVLPEHVDDAVLLAHLTGLGRMQRLRAS